MSNMKKEHFKIITFAQLKFPDYYNKSLQSSLRTPYNANGSLVSIMPFQTGTT